MRVAALLVPDVKRLLADDPLDAVELTRELHPEDLADVAHELTPREIGRLFAVLPTRDGARLLERLDDHEQRDVLTELTARGAVDLVAAMEPDRRAKLFRVIPAALRDPLLAALRASAPEIAAEVEQLSRWPEGTAGRLMTTSFVAIPMGRTVGDALDALRAHNATSNEPVHALYGLDAAGRLAAFARLRELALLAHDQPMADAWRRPVLSVLPTSDQVEVARTMARYDLAAVPVVDAEGALLGLISIDDVVDVMVGQASRAFERAGAVEPLDAPYFRTSFWSFMRKRGLWLIVLFVEEFFTQTALRHYDPVFSALHGASYYVPLLISTGGNSGSQSATLVIRGMSVREIRLRDWWRIFLREASMGIALGCLLGVIGFGRVLMYHDQHVAFALTIGLTLVGIVIVGCTVGSMLPLVLRRLGVDPATSSTPFIASLVDVLGIIVFVHVSKVVMADVLARAALHAGQ